MADTTSKSTRSRKAPAPAAPAEPIVATVVGSDVATVDPTEIAALSGPIPTLPGIISTLDARQENFFARHGDDVAGFITDDSIPADALVARVADEVQAGEVVRGMVLTHAAMAYRNLERRQLRGETITLPGEEPGKTRPFNPSNFAKSVGLSGNSAPMMHRLSLALTVGIDPKTHAALWTAIGQVGTSAEVTAVLKDRTSTIPDVQTAVERAKAKKKAKKAETPATTEAAAETRAPRPHDTPAAGGPKEDESVLADVRATLDAVERILKSPATVLTAAEWSSVHNTLVNLQAQADRLRKDPKRIREAAPESAPEVQTA